MMCCLDKVNWFPRHISELDMIANHTLDAGIDLEADHPGFYDQTYRKRRQELADFALNHTWDKPIAEIEYTEDEIHCWTSVWDQMEPLWKIFACTPYLRSLELMKEHCNYTRTNIPQQKDISVFLESTTNFHLRPVAGLLSSRDFLNGLAHRTFFCTQYIRVSSRACLLAMLSFHYMYVCFLIFSPAYKTSICYRYVLRESASF
ncbi:MAG: phenylalanine-4-hydroxylase [Bacillariaceae sp.]|jgi:phenylalanine-4-hydroxylase